MKSDKIKKWRFYDLTEKQVVKIAVVVDIIVAIISIIYLASIFEKVKVLSEFVMLVVVFFVFVPSVGVAIWLFLWEFPPKQYYLFWREHDEEIVPKVREKFGLNFEFKEVLPIDKDEFFYFAKENEDEIWIKKVNSDGEEISLQKINNYYFFESHYKPKI